MSNKSTDNILYSDTLNGACHWSMRIRKGMLLRITDIEGGANVGMLFYNPDNLLERYNAPDTLKCQHTFKLTKGHCLYSDMGRIFCSIVDDTTGWHETVCGNLTKSIVTEKWGEHSYQQHQNDWYKNGYDSFLVELAKYGLGKKDMAANLNLFSRVETDNKGNLKFIDGHSTAGDYIDLRFEMDTLVFLHTCPHPLNTQNKYPRKPVQYEMRVSDPIEDDDICLTSCAENQRGFENNRIYHLGLAR